MVGNGKFPVILLALILVSSVAIELNAEGMTDLDNRVMTIESELEAIKLEIGNLQSAIPNSGPALDAITEQIKVITGSLKNGWVFFVGISGLLVTINIMMYLVFILPLNHKVDIMARLKSTPLDKMTKDILLKPMPLKDLKLPKPEETGKVVATPVDIKEEVKEVAKDGSA